MILNLQIILEGNKLGSKNISGSYRSSGDWVWLLAGIAQVLAKDLSLARKQMDYLDQGLPGEITATFKYYPLQDDGGGGGEKGRGQKGELAP